MKSQSRRLTDPEATEHRRRKVANGSELAGGDDRAQLLSLADHRADAQDRDFGEAPCRRSPDSPPIPLAVEALRCDPLRVRGCPPVARFAFGFLIAGPKRFVQEQEHTVLKVATECAKEVFWI